MSCRWLTVSKVKPRPCVHRPDFWITVSHGWHTTTYNRKFHIFSNNVKWATIANQLIAMMRQRHNRFKLIIMYKRKLTVIVQMFNINVYITLSYNDVITLLYTRKNGITSTSGSVHNPQSVDFSSWSFTKIQK